MIEERVTQEAVHYRVYSTRWIQLIVYVLVSFANALPSMTFVPIISQTEKFYNITTTEVNILPMLYLFLYVFGTILSILLSRKFSMRVIMIIGSILNIGVFIRLFSLIKPNQGYPALVIGQICISIAQPIFINVTALFAARWFPPSQRDIATAIGSMANPLGKILNK